MEEIEFRDDHCFCCGKDNVKGLHLEFSYPSPGRSETSLKIPGYFSGWKSLTHGGLLSMLLDETMAHACHGIASMAVTGEMSVKFRKPVHVEETVTLEGSVEEVRSRIIVTRGVVRNEEGEIVAEGNARFLITAS